MRVRPTAVVTASGGMMGASIAVALAGAGYDLVLNDRRDGTLPPVEERVRELGADATSVLTDVSTREGAHAVVGAALERWGTVDVLVNVAGGLKGPLHNPILEITDEQWARTFAVNVDSAFRCMQAALPTMIERRRGKIVNIASTNWAGSAMHAHYAASKAALVSLTRSVANQVGVHDVNVNVIAPGGTQTSAADLPGFPTAEQWKTANPLGRPNLPDDIAEAVLFLVSDAARNITGQILNVAGGLNPSL